jgi:hypothetical protein
LPVPGAPISSTPFGALPPTRVYLSWRLEEVDQLDQFVLGLVDAGDIVERDPRLPLVVVAARLAAADARKAAAQPALLRGAPVHSDLERDDQQRRAEA